MGARLTRSAIARRFLVVSVALLSLTIGCGRMLMLAMPPGQWPQLRFPPVFALSTFALLLGSHALARAMAAVRQERQPEFCRWLLRAAGWGSLFVALQMAGLNWLFQRQVPDETAIGEQSFVAVFATLHALHFSAALLFLAYVLVQAWSNRYDHEYYWGVVVCAWFWHLLALAWLAVLAVIVITSI